MNEKIAAIFANLILFLAMLAFLYFSQSSLWWLLLCPAGIHFRVDEKKAKRDSKKLKGNE